MKSFRHLTSRYIVNRFKELIYHRKHPTHPWLTESANLILKSYLKDSDVGLEFGSGRSTLWFAQRVSALTSVEHNPIWYNKITKMLEENGNSNVTYLLFENDRGEGEGYDSEYVQVINRFSKDSLDFVLIDGIYRSACVNMVLEKIRPGGLLVIDNVNWYLPRESVALHSRTFEQGPASPEWSECLDMMKRWRCIWTSSGVTDTALYIKPCHVNSEKA